MDRQTTLPNSHRKEVLFFATAHFLFFNFLTAAQVAHFVLPQPHKPTQRQNKKSHFFQRFLKNIQQRNLSLNYSFTSKLNQYV